MYPWQKHFQFGVVHPAHFPTGKEPEAYLQSLKRVLSDTMFQAIEIGPIPFPELKPRVIGMLKSAGVDVVFLGGGTLKVNNLNLCDIDEAGRRAAVSRLAGLVDEAYEVGARSMLVMSGQDYPDARQKALEQLARSVCEIGQYSLSRAKDYPLWFVFETFDREATVKQILGRTNEAAAFIRHVRSATPHVGLTMDQSHFPQMCEDPVRAIFEAGDTAAHAHLANCFVKDPSNELYGDRHLCFGFPGSENDIEDIAGYLQALLDSGFATRPGPHLRPVVSLEVKPWPGEDMDLVLAGAKRAYLRACDLVSWPK